MNHTALKPITALTDELSNLCAETLGPGRFARTAYRLREQAEASTLWGFNAYKDDQLIGTISLTSLTIGGKEGASLLGPLLVAEDHRGKGLGLKLIEKALLSAKERGSKLVLLVGDVAYYEKAGFVNVPPQSITLPGPVDPNRLLAHEIKKGSLESFKGQAKAI